MHTGSGPAGIPATEGQGNEKFAHRGRWSASGTRAVAARHRAARTGAGGWMMGVVPEAGGRTGPGHGERPRLAIWFTYRVGSSYPGSMGEGRTGRGA